MTEQFFRVFRYQQPVMSPHSSQTSWCKVVQISCVGNLLVVRLLLLTFSVLNGCLVVNDEKPHSQHDLNLWTRNISWATKFISSNNFQQHHAAIKRWIARCHGISWGSIQNHYQERFQFAPPTWNSAIRLDCIEIWIPTEIFSSRSSFSTKKRDISWHLMIFPDWPSAHSAWHSSHDLNDVEEVQGHRSGPGRNKTL